jgi:hypothetical protein
MYRRSMIGGAAAAGLVLGAGGGKTDPALVLAQSTILDSRGGPVEAEYHQLRGDFVWGVSTSSYQALGIPFLMIRMRPWTRRTLFSCLVPARPL